MASQRYSPGDKAYIVESGRFIREVIVWRVTGDLCTLRFVDSEGGIKLRASRLFPTKEAAKASVREGVMRL